MGLQAGGRRHAAVPSGAARLLHPEYVALPVRRGGGHSTFSSPCGASGYAAGAGRGPESELLRFFSEISADENGLAVVSVPPLPTGWVAGTHCEPGLCSAASSRDPIWSVGRALATPHAQSGARPPGLQFPEEPAVAAGAEPLTPS